METEKIKSKDYFILRWHAYFADYNWDYIILRDKDPWEVYYRQMPGGMPINPFEGDGFEIKKEWGWHPVEMDTAKLKKYMLTRAKPETWKNVTRKFYENHQVGGICDGPTLSITFIKPNGRKKEMGYLLYEFPEEWHPSYQRACRLMRYLQRYGKKGKSKWSGFVG